LELLSFKIIQGLNKAHDFNPLGYLFQGKSAKWSCAAQAVERIHSGQSSNLQYQISFLRSIHKL
jgi:hypothetical protein